MLMDNERKSHKMITCESSEKGLIFNVAHYAIHDGPGIRTSIFLKGCPGRCLWCSNPESQEYSPEIVIRNGKVQTIGRWVSPEELILEVEKDRPFWRRSGGGVTITGGEPLFQPRFVKKFLTLCKNKNIHTAIETSLFTDSKTLHEVLDLVDYVQFDIKEMDPDRHLKLTGMDNEIILQNAATLLCSTKPLLVRFPFVPGCNDQKESLKELGSFLEKYRPGVCLEILPYHRMGVGKYEELGKTYALPDTKPPTRLQVDEIVKILRNFSICIIYEGREMN